MKILKQRIREFIAKDSQKLFINDIEKIMEDGYKHPLDDHEIIKRLEGNNNATRVEDYIDAINDRRTKQIIVNAREAIKNYPLNPNHKYPPLLYYIKNKDLLKYFDSLRDDLTDLLNPKIIYIGNRGSGKTLSQNCWIHKNNKELEKNNIFWVRCDAAKLYRMWLKPEFQSTPDTRLVTIEQYLTVQLLYVFIKHHPDSELIKEIVREIINNKPTYMHRRSRKDHTMTHSNIDDGLKKMERIVSSENGKPRDFSYAIFLMEQYQKPDNFYHLAWEEWISLSNALEQYMLTHNYKIFKIIDGVDNIEFYDKKSLKFFKLMMRQVAFIIANKSSKGIVHMIVARPESYSHLKSTDISTEPYQYDTQIKKIVHQYPNIQELKTLRIKYIKSVFNEIPKKNNKHQINPDYLEVLEKTFLKEPPNENFEIMYNGDIRLYLYGLLSLSLQIYYRACQIKQKLDNNLFNKLYNLFYDRNKLLDGRLFLNSKNEETSTLYQGRYMFNPFYFDTSKYYVKKEDNKKQWPGLCSVRIFQTIKHTNCQVEKSIISFLNNEFGYKKDYISRCFIMLQNYGIIKATSDNALRTIKYQITSKGETFFDFIFSRFDILYYLALDTPLPKSFYTSHSVLSHTNKVYYADNYSIPTPSEYISSSLITTYHFIKLITSIDHYERENISTNHLVKTKFHLPINSLYNYYPILKRAMRLYANINKEEKTIVRDKIFSIS